MLWLFSRFRMNERRDFIEGGRFAMLSPSGVSHVRKFHTAACSALPGARRRFAGDFGAILARVAQGEGLPSLVIAALRLGLAALIVTPLAWWQSRHVLRALTRRQLWLALGAGLFLALHFAAWISSLEYTSVASSTALVTTNPVWIGLAAFFFLGERTSRMTLAGIVVSLSRQCADFLE